LAPAKAAVVAYVAAAVRAERCAVGSAAELRDHGSLAVADARETPGGDLDDEHAAVRQGHRPFRKAQTRCELSQFHGFAGATINRKLALDPFDRTRRGGRMKRQLACIAALCAA